MRIQLNFYIFQTGAGCAKIKERMKLYMETISHDRLFKELLTNFFQELMEAFFPEAGREPHAKRARGVPGNGYSYRDRRAAGSRGSVCCRYDKVGNQ